MNRGDNIMLSPAPINMVTIARVGKPEARITLLNEKVRLESISPGSMYIMKSRA